MKISYPKYIALIAILLFCIPAFVIAQEITFTFNPPDSTTSNVFVTNEETHKIIMEESKTNRVDQYEELYLKTDSGFSVTGTLLSTVAFENGEKQEANILSPFVGVPLKYIVDPYGSLDSIVGYPVLQDSLTIGSMADFAEDMPHYYDYEPYFIRVATDWQYQLRDFAGRTFRIGDTLRIVDTVNNIEGTIYITKKVWLAEMTAYDGVDCVVIEYVHSIDMDYSEMYTDAISTYYTDPDYSFLNSDFEVLGDHTDTKGQQIMDPSTMLIYYTREEKTETLQVGMYGGLEMATQVHTIHEAKTVYDIKNK